MPFESGIFRETALKEATGDADYLHYYVSTNLLESPPFAQLLKNFSIF
jgi:hypothetical protein